MGEGERQVSPEAFRYWAFISSSQRDEVWAKKLHRALKPTVFRAPWSDAASMGGPFRGSFSGSA